MFISWRDIINAMKGFWRLIHLDPYGLVYFDSSFKGIKKSFFLALPLLPLYIIFTFYQAKNDLEIINIKFVTVYGLAYIIGWVAFPLFAYYLIRFMGHLAYYNSYIVVYNWFTLPQMVLFFLLFLLLQSGWVPENFIGLLMAVLSIASMVGLWIITSITLLLPGVGIFALILSDIIIEIVLDLSVKFLLA
ncbi:MAG: hypothetical protein K1X44_00420 [Alphaproteobacteria bacterium]|nr:hypothetical protein [Alphaproteobacteria bacterium]